MRYLNYCLLFIAPLLLSSRRDKPAKLHLERSGILRHIPEPSDVVYDKDSGHYFIVSDHGILFECDTNGTILRKAAKEGMDFEGVEVKDGYVYVSDEKPRRVYKYSKDKLELEKVYTVSFSGAMNKAFESITYNYSKNCFVMVSQQPAVIYEYDDNFQVLNKYPFPGARDISAARWYNGSFYLLSNKDNTLYLCDASTYEVKKTYKLNIINPEGLAFDAGGRVIVTSDDMQSIYLFNSLPN